MPLHCCIILHVHYHTTLKSTGSSNSLKENG
nr:MAG TPA: hypothetical protein [Caudoviricetes sp.]